ncbi:NUDIX hydrolase domain-like protein [Gautieria morchelliformis]|nr:NUDIX hydrolase domain-like protein [Gautieria morchelliformis]
MTETTNFLGGGFLNRLSWLRSSPKFLNMAIQTPESRWAVFRAGQPLVTQSPNGGAKALAMLKTSHVKHLLGEEPFFGQGQSPGESATPDASVLEACRLRGLPIVFLGLNEPEGTTALPSSDFRTPETANDISGAPFFSIDITGVSAAVTDELLASAAEGGESLGFDEPRSTAAQFSMFDAATFSVARSMLDWNTRNKFCAGCGSPTYSMWGGWKLSCSTLLPWSNNEGKQPCITAKGLHNFAHPRTDPVVIMAIIDETGDRILLGRNRRFPASMFSTMAGFCEPAESFEDAVKREIWEESGVRVHNVHYHSSQPWPYPSSLMVGCYAFADSSLPVRTDLDNELAEARWFTRAEVAAVLAHPLGRIIDRTDYKQLDNPSQKHAMAVAAQDPPPFRIPPQTAIAGVLISDWAAGKYGGGTVKGNL